LKYFFNTNFVEVHQDVVFNPYQALTGGSHLLPITDGRDPNQIILGTGYREEEPEKGKERKRTSKWGEEWEKSFQPPIYNNIPRGLTIDDVEYLMRLHRLDEITRNLNLNDLEMGDQDIRSPSPDPVYDKNGVRVNTRIVRAKEKLLREKNDLIEECARLRKNFVPPAEYKPPKKSKKIFLPEADGPDNQYIGMVLGPKGTTQKTLEGKTGCKISVRGKGSSKQKRMEYDSDEKLHVLIQGDTDEQVERGAEEVEKILRGDIVEPTEAQKAKNLQLVAVSSALGDEFCNNCGEPGHRSWNCPNKASFIRAAIKCAICGDRSHPTSDCPQKKSQNTGLGIGFEFSEFMASLSGNKKPAQQHLSSETTGFITNNSKPVLALTFGAGGPSAYPQPTNTYSAYQATPMMNNNYTQPTQSQRQQNQGVPNNMYASQDAGGQRPIAYSMSAGAGVPNFINPMMMGSYPQANNQASNISITTVNPNMPMGAAPNMQGGQYGMGAFPGYGYNYMNTNAYQAFQMNNQMNNQMNPQMPNQMNNQANYQNYMNNNTANK